MKVMSKILLLSSLLVAFSLGSCGDDNDDPEPCNYSVELQAEVDAYVAAATAYGQDPSAANCLAYKNSLLAFLDAAEDLEACAIAAGQGAEYQQSIDSAQAAANALTC